MQTLKICEEEFIIQDKLKLIDAGFKLETDLEETKITVPEGWSYKEINKNPMTGEFYDESNNFRGCIYYNRVFFRCRYAFVTIPVDKDEGLSEDERLILVDRKNNKIIFDFGTVSFVSEYTSNLLLLAQSKIRAIYPEYENPYFYWDTD